MIEKIFNEDLLNSIRKIKYPNEFKISGEIRLLGIIASACLVVVNLIPIGNRRYIKGLMYIETLEGGSARDQSIKIKQLYSDFDIDYVVLDINGIGIGVFDRLVESQIDSERNNIMYPAWGCINDEKMNDRCKTLDAKKIIYSINATTQFNSNCNITIRDTIKNQTLNLLVGESEGNDILNKNKPFQNLSVEEQKFLRNSYYQTSCLIEEMVNLDYEIINGKIRVKESSGIGKDRYTILMYTLEIARKIEKDIAKKCFLKTK